MERLLQGTGSGGCFTIFGNPEDHELFARHQAAEYPTETTGRGRNVTVWTLFPDRPDNDWLDCGVGACVAGSIAARA